MCVDNVPFCDNLGDRPFVCLTKPNDQTETLKEKQTNGSKNKFLHSCILFHSVLRLINHQHSLAYVEFVWFEWKVLWFVLLLAIYCDECVQITRITAFRFNDSYKQTLQHHVFLFQWTNSSFIFCSWYLCSFCSNYSRSYNLNKKLLFHFFYFTLCVVEFVVAFLLIIRIEFWFYTIPSTFVLALDSSQDSAVQLFVRPYQNRSNSST